MVRDAEQLRKWATFNRVNYCLFFSSVVYIAVCIVVFVIGVETVNEVMADANENIAFEQLVTNPHRPTPCGLPTTDALHLLQTLNRHERSFGMPQLIEPSYKEWVTEVKSALCAGDQGWLSDGSDGRYPGTDAKNDLESEDATETLENEARELRTIAQLIRNWTVASATTVTTTTVAEARNQLELNACEPDDEKSFYTHRLHQAYGDVYTRVARAYVAAGPAFYQYRRRRSENDNLGCLDERNPFQTTMCPNSDHVEVVLQRAGTADAARRLFGYTETSLPSFTEMLYALLALSVVGHTDRTANNGACFKNDDAGTPHNSTLVFCKSVYDAAEFANGDYFVGVAAATPLAGYALTDASIKTTQRCTRNHYPPSPPSAPPLYRVDNSGSTDHEAVTAVCASLLQYGLFDQGRLFGVPDVLDSFVLDVRVGASSHILAPPIYNSMFFDVLDKGGNALYEPVRRLEVYLVYRVGSLTIWAMLISCVVGFFVLRSSAPVSVQLMRFADIKNREGETPFLIRPSIDVSSFLAAFTAILGGYWTLYTDPAIQAHYPISPSCDDWMFGQDHSSSGAYVTSWGKRRFSRYGEQIIGILLFVLAVFPFLYTGIAKVLDKRIGIMEDEKDKEPELVTRDDATFWILFVCAVAKQLIVAIQTGLSAGKWRELLVSQADTTESVDIFTRDCKTAILVAFWTGATVGLARQRWTVKDLSTPIQVAWSAGTIFFCLLTIVSYNALMPDEWETAFRTPSGDRSRLISIGFLLAVSGVETLIILWNLRTLFMADPGPEHKVVKQERFKDAADDATVAAEEKAADEWIEGTSASAVGFPRRLDLMNIRMSRQQQKRGGYLPVLRLPH